jgi:transcriptional regulator with GAF, ATPase, and Fis domain
VEQATSASKAAADNVWKELESVARAVREESDPARSLRVIGEAMNRLIGSRMFTFLRFDDARFEMQRLHCTQPVRYPIGEWKPMRRDAWYESVAERGDAFLVRGHEQMRATFGARSGLFELGCTGSMCVPVRHAGRTLGTMNLNGDETCYNAQSAGIAGPFATLAVPAFLAIPRGD